MRLLLLLLLLVPLVMTQQSSSSRACVPGEWLADNGGGECRPCPQGFECPDGILIRECDSRKTRSLGPGSKKCCPLNQTCSSKIMAVGSDCMCHMIECGEGLSLTQLRNGGGYECIPLRECARCPALGWTDTRGFVQDRECQCVRWKECTKGQVWRLKEEGYVLFECFVVGA